MTPLLVQAVQISEPMEITTSAGIVLARRGEWLVQGPHGEYYTCSDEEFKRTFERTEAAFGLAAAPGKEYGC